MIKTNYNAINCKNKNYLLIKVNHLNFLVDKIRCLGILSILIFFASFKYLIIFQSNLEQLAYDPSEKIFDLRKFTSQYIFYKVQIHILKFTFLRNHHISLNFENLLFVL